MTQPPQWIKRDWESDHSSPSAVGEGSKLTPPLPPPRRPPVAQLPPAAGPSRLSGTSMPATSLSRNHLRAKAATTASRWWNSGSGYIAPKLERAAEGITNRLNEFNDRREVDRSRGWEEPRYATYRTRPRTSLEEKVHGLERGLPPEHLDSIERNRQNSTIYGTNSAEDSGSRWTGITSYFSLGSKERRDQTFYTEERIVSFPGWATLRASAHTGSEPALVLDVLVHGYAYRLRPPSQATRSQRVFYALAKSFVALPKVPAHLAEKTPPESGLHPNSSGMSSANQSSDSLNASSKEQADVEAAAVAAEAATRGKTSVFETLLEIGGREEEGEAEDELDRSLEEKLAMAMHKPITAEPMSHNTAQEPSHARSGVQTTAHEAARKVNSSLDPAPKKFQRNTGMASPHRAARSNSADGKEMPRSVSGTGSLPSRSSTMPSMPSNHQASSYEADIPPVASAALMGRSRASFATERKGYRANPPILSTDEWPKPFTYETEDLPRLHRNLQERLLPFFGQKLAGRKVRISIYPVSSRNEKLLERPLATKVITTGSGGSFTTSLEVPSNGIRQIIEATGKDVSCLEKEEVKVVAELLEMEPTGDPVHFLPHHSLRATNEDISVLNMGRDIGVRVISDVDDTIKHTEVTAGTKTIFRNVFVRELDEIRVPGMSHWYQAMRDAGVNFHYVSNSPWELWNVIKAFLLSSNFPSGSVTLKEYGGATSALAKLWEEPGMRKRAGVENILKEFPHCKFILIGDSGEQDLDLYVQLAIEYPSHILGIFIRDVTTPFAPNMHPDLTQMRKSEKPGQTQLMPRQAKDGLSDDGAKKPSALAKPSGRNGEPMSSTRPSSTLPDLPDLPPPSPPLFDQDVDDLSPNNPLRPEPTLGSTVQSEEAAALVESFYERLVHAEKVLPRGIPLRLFRHGKECEEEALRLVKQQS